MVVFCYSVFIIFHSITRIKVVTNGLVPVPVFVRVPRSGQKRAKSSRYFHFSSVVNDASNRGQQEAPYLIMTICHRDQTVFIVRRHLNDVNFPGGRPLGEPADADLAGGRSAGGSGRGKHQVR